MSALREKLEALYSQYNRKEFVSPDPLQFLYDYADPADREVAGLISSSLAYGRVAQILQSVSIILKPLGPKPAERIRDAVFLKRLEKTYSGFKHRWHTADDLLSLLHGIRSTLLKYGSLDACMRREKAFLPALSLLVSELRKGRGGMRKNLVSDPGEGSACKRLLMYARWMIRSDAIDPGGWSCFKPSDLVIPLDTHMFRVSRRLKLTRSNQANLKAALDLTRKFLKLSPDDPVRYDFVLTRPGIWGRENLLDIFK